MEGAALLTKTRDVRTAGANIVSDEDRRPRGLRPLVITKDAARLSNDSERIESRVRGLPKSSSHRLHRFHS
jgi:hypothetical protein